MRWLVGISGYLMLAVGLGVLGLIGFALASGLSPVQSVGYLWFALDTGSLNALQVILERYLWPPLWGYLALPFLMMPALWAVVTALVPGIILVGYAWLGMRRR